MTHIKISDVLDKNADLHKRNENLRAKVKNLKEALLLSQIDKSNRTYMDREIINNAIKS